MHTDFFVLYSKAAMCYNCLFVSFIRGGRRPLLLETGVVLEFSDGVGRQKVLLGELALSKRILRMNLQQLSPKDYPDKAILKSQAKPRRVPQQKKPHVRILYFNNGYKVTWVALENVSPLDEGDIVINEESLAISSGANRDIDVTPLTKIALSPSDLSSAARVLRIVNDNEEQDSGAWFAKLFPPIKSSPPH